MQFLSNVLKDLKSAPLLINIHDTFSTSSHSQDFTFARANYFRSRVLAVALIFLALTPLWFLFDIFLLPRSVAPIVLPARLLMTLGILLVALLAYKDRQKVRTIYLATALLFLLPLAFYVCVVVAVGQERSLSLLAYEFVPYMLTAMMAIFPLTLLEGLILGGIFFIARIFALFIGGLLFSANGLEAL